MATLDQHVELTTPRWDDIAWAYDLTAVAGTRDRKWTFQTAFGRFGNRFLVTQTAHGFAVGTLVAYGGAAWTQSLATDAASAVYTGIVVQTDDVDSFEVLLHGYVGGLTGLPAAGSDAFLQDDGSLGANPGTVRVPVLRTASTTAGWLRPCTLERVELGPDLGSSGVALDVPWGRGEIIAFTLSDAATLTFSQVPAVGRVRLILTQDATGSRVVTWPAAVVWPGGAAPTLSTAAAAVDVIDLFTRDGGTTVYGVIVGQAFS